MLDQPTSKTAARPDVTRAITRGVCRYLAAVGISPLCEFKLIGRRRADVAGA